LVVMTRPAESPGIDDNQTPNLTPDQTEEVTDNTAQNREVVRTGDLSEKVIVNTPAANSEASSPITVSGSAPGNWFFEAVAPVSVVNWDGLIIGEGYVTADGDWMTTDNVEFSGTVTYELAADTPYNRGWLILKRDNPSGMPENDAAVEIPIILSTN